MAYRTSPADLEGMPPGVPHIVGNEAAERFSFYGMKAVLAVFMVQYLHLMDGPSGGGMSDAAATEKVHLFNTAVYLTPFLGALLADFLWGKYRTIIALSLVYCMGHAALACMGVFGNSPLWLMMGLGLIALGSGGIKPCVSAHVGDQFGARNAALLPRVFNWFYFSINLGAFASAMLTPWLLKWHGPHWAFGVPGVLMALATLIFWMGRKRFIHVPAGGRRFFDEVFCGGGIQVILKLLPLYVFVAMFWALFDQTSTRFIFQAIDMDRTFLGIEWLPSQLQSLNSIFVLTFIPLFAYLIYPWVSRVWPLSPLRKIGIGLFVMVLSFGLVAVVQEWIDGGARPNIGWQVLVIALLTAAEVMVSIVALEFAYTQAPKTMKSLMMCLYLGSVAVGNLFVAGVNHFIQIPSGVEEQWQAAVAELGEDERAGNRQLRLPGADGRKGTADDLLREMKDGRPGDLTIPAEDLFKRAAERVEALASANGGKLPDEERVRAEFGSEMTDPWGNELQYQILNSDSARLSTAGPDRELGTLWDIGLILKRKEMDEAATESWSDAFHPEQPWLERRKAELGWVEQAGTKAVDEPSQFKQTAFCGGQTRLEGADYFWFFTWMMLGTAVLFVPYAVLYHPQTVLQD